MRERMSEKAVLPSSMIGRIGVGFSDFCMSGVRRWSLTFFSSDELQFENGKTSNTSN